MNFVIDLTPFYDLASRSPLEIAWILFVKGGWVIIGIMLLRLWWMMRILKLQARYLQGIEYTLLAIDIPKDSEQTPKAMEQVFATISGAHSPLVMPEKWKGVVQLSFSFEIVSIDGYIQFLVRTPKVHRDLVESAIYAHYPDAEITEVLDYTSGMPRTFPNDQYNLWGSELSLAANEAQPLRTYESFEDKLTQEFKDPVAGVIETMSRIKKGEQVWFQIIVCPTENADWVNKHIAYAFKLAGKKKAPGGKKSWYTRILDPLYSLPDWIPFLRTDGSVGEKKDQLDFRMMNLTPGERNTIEAIERKASKLGFICKVRLIYLAPPELFSSKRVVSSVFGAFKQFGDLTSNSLKPNKRTKTQVAYYNVQRRLDARRTRIIRNFMSRSWYTGSKYFILNTEELATLYHFPSITVTSPYLKRTEAKKSDAPVQLPAGIEVTEPSGEKYLRKQLERLELDNDYYENLYSAEKTVPLKRATSENARTGTTASVEPDDDAIPDNLPIAQ